MTPSDTILIVDFGSQVTQLIARRVREAGVYSEIVPFSAAGEAFDRLQPKGIILSGGPQSVHWEDSPRAPQHFFDRGLPILGICYGQQAMAEQLGGRVAPGGQNPVLRSACGIRGRRRRSTPLRHRKFWRAILPALRSISPIGVFRTPLLLPFWICPPKPHLKNQ